VCFENSRAAATRIRPPPRHRHASAVTGRRMPRVQPGATCQSTSLPRRHHPYRTARVRFTRWSGRAAPFILTSTGHRCSGAVWIADRIAAGTKGVVQAPGDASNASGYSRAFNGPRHIQPPAQSLRQFRQTRRRQSERRTQPHGTARIIRVLRHRRPRSQEAFSSVPV